MKTVELYHKYFKEYSAKFERDSLAVMMQVGDFYEFYGVEGDGYDSELCFGNVVRIANVLEIAQGRKNKDEKFVSITSPLFTGFPKHSADKHIQKLLQQDFAIVIIDQYGEGKDITRAVSKVLTASTYIDGSINSERSKVGIASLYIGEAGVGVSYINTLIGQTKSYEIIQDSSEIVRFIESENPGDILVYYHDSVDICKYDSLLKTIELSQSRHVYVKSLPQYYNKPTTQESILKQYYTSRGFLTAIEYIGMEIKQNALTSLVCILQYLKDLDNEIVSQLQKPILIEDSSIMKLCETALYQLDILKLKKVIDHTKTAGGSRVLKQNMLSPVTCTDTLNTRYETIAALKGDVGVQIRKHLHGLIDFDRYIRKWCLNRISPIECAAMIHNMKYVKSLMTLCKENDLFGDFTKRVFDLNTFIDTCENTFDMKALEKFTYVHTVDENVFKSGYSTELDEHQHVISDCLEKAHSISKLLDTENSEVRGAVKFERTAVNDMWFISTTKKKVSLLKQQGKLDKYTVKDQKSNSRLYSSELDSLKNKHNMALEQLVSIVKRLYKDVLTVLYEIHGHVLSSIVEQVNWIDVYTNGAWLAHHYDYNSPTIVERSDGYIKGCGIRHPIIERLDERIKYVPNDIELNDRGMLLFGLNGGGKSSLMKSVGLTVVLAQMGYYVPCSSFHYSPFTRLFTRISGDDNIIKGLSSFAVEMRELKGILHYSDTKSLVLGDEICKGTEYASALSIVSASLLTLSRRNKAKFIFATHLHSLSDVPEIKESVGIYHLSVNCQDDVLIYNRTLQTGPGPSLYGLEVARHILHDTEVIELAESFREGKQPPVTVSKYNSKLTVQQCEICAHMGIKNNQHTQLHTHHIDFQCNANEHNLISNGVHKNSQANLVVLCEHHHTALHNDEFVIHGWIETSNGVVLKWDKNQPILPSKRCKYSDTEIEIIQSYKDSHLPKCTILKQLKCNHNISISAATFSKYIKQ